MIKGIVMHNVKKSKFKTLKCRNVLGKMCCWDTDKRTFFYVDLTPVIKPKEMAEAVAVFMDEEETHPEHAAAEPEGAL